MRKHNYVVGFSGDGQVVYGKDIPGDSSYVELLTYKGAQKAVEKLVKPSYSRSKRYVYKLEEVYTID